ncbi:MAG: TIGR02266 family protein [Myxococcota bacterium]
MADENSGSTDDDRREHRRYPAAISVDYSDGEHFLFAYIENISEMGIFIRTDEPHPVGTELSLRFGPEDAEPLELAGEVVWINPVRAVGENLNPGMGVRFRNLTPEQREQVVDVVRTVAYLQHSQSN